jgi:hypothetical protein
LKNRSEKGLAGKPRSGCSQNSAGRGQILLVLQVNSRSIDKKSGEIWTAQADLQPISFKSDRLLEVSLREFHANRAWQSGFRVNSASHKLFLLAHKFRSGLLIN